MTKKVHPAVSERYRKMQKLSQEAINKKLIEDFERRNKKNKESGLLKVNE